MGTRDEVLTVADHLGAYVLEWTLHHLDLVAHLPDARTRPPEEGLARSRTMLEKIARTAFPTSFTDRDALLIGTGRRTPTDARRTELRNTAGRFPSPWPDPPGPAAPSPAGSPRLTGRDHDEHDPFSRRALTLGVDDLAVVVDR
ncbi:hypothetical protein [Streptomyces virginiae]|uniref:hypothetical protein n=1 Tax=Streptomyces virginiae TaxID=1961 RepID=UPI0036EC04F7